MQNYKKIVVTCKQLDNSQSDTYKQHFCVIKKLKPLNMIQY